MDDTLDQRRRAVDAGPVDENFGRVPRVYVQCLRDRAMTPKMQREMYTALPCRQVVTMETSHSPFWSAPEELARHLSKIAAAWSADAAPLDGQPRGARQIMAVTSRGPAVVVRSHSRDDDPQRHDCGATVVTMTLNVTIAEPQS